MRNATRWLTICAVAAALAVAGVTLSGALRAHRAARETALEWKVLTRNIEFSEAKLASDPANWLLGGYLADLYALRFRAAAELADIVRAEELARAGLAVRAESSAGYARLSSILLTQHRFAEAYDAARRATAVPSPSDGALAVFVDAARAFGDYGGADSALARMHPGSFAASIRSADRLTAEGRVPAAQRRASRACERLVETGAPRELRAWCLTRLAALEHERGGPDAARVRLREALAVRPAHRGALEMLADLAHAQGDWRHARLLYERIATAAHPDLYLRLAEVNRALGDVRAAAQHERRFLALATAPGLETLSALPLALHLAETGQCGAAGALAQRELARRRATEAIERVAWIQFRCGDATGALRALTEAERAAQLSPSASYLRGLLLRESGNEAAAAALLASATADPTRLEPHVREHMRRERAGAT